MTTSLNDSKETTPFFYELDYDFFMELAKNNREKYINASPFANIYFDNVFPEKALNLILSEFPDSNQIDWKNFQNKNEVKLASNDEVKFGEFTRHFIHVLNSKPFIEFLEQLTGIDNLIADAKLVGGGLHQILKGGLLKIHADFNKHYGNDLDRRLNVLIYLNKDWEEEYGGHFELWDSKMEKAELKILPLFNRMAIFSTTSKSYHGHPDALNCPEDRSRKSIAMYYYTNGRPKSEIEEVHTTLFQSRKGKSDGNDSNPVKKIIKDLMPPIITKAIKKIRS